MALQKSYLKKLYAIAESQNGHFTAKQALMAGYSNRMQTYHVQNGDWIKETRGIFRLDSFPLIDGSEISIWYLWSSNRRGEPQGVYSHETALALHRLCPWNAKRLHLTVPPGFQRSVVPSVLHLHRKAFEAEEVDTRFGIRLTNPLRTIIDLLSGGGLSRRELQQALMNAIDRQIILPGQIAKTDLKSKERERFVTLMQETVR